MCGQFSFSFTMTQATLNIFTKYIKIFLIDFFVIHSHMKVQLRDYFICSSNIYIKKNIKVKMNSSNR